MFILQLRRKCILLICFLLLLLFATVVGKDEHHTKIKPIPSKLNWIVRSQIRPRPFANIHAHETYSHIHSTCNTHPHTRAHTHRYLQLWAVWINGHSHGPLYTMMALRRIRNGRASSVFWYGGHCCWWCFEFVCAWSCSLLFTLSQNTEHKKTQTQRHNTADCDRISVFALFVPASVVDFHLTPECLRYVNMFIFVVDLRSSDVYVGGLGIEPFCGCNCGFMLESSLPINGNAHTLLTLFQIAQTQTHTIHTRE